MNYTEYFVKVQILIISEVSALKQLLTESIDFI